MSSAAAFPAPLVVGTRGFLRWICTNNPFYILSAGLFFIGLRVSFDMTGDVEAWAMIAGLTGYTLLLAVTGIVLVRFARVWDDARTVLLLVVLMLLATSVTLDELLVVSPLRGTLCYLGGLLFAFVVSEAILRGIRLRLPAGFRLPYYLILSLFFLYPLALAPVLDQPHSEALMWGLFGFSTVAGLAFLTLLPAIRRGPNYVRDNGSPWPWPLYPWSLFVFLALAVPGRAFLLCWSFHLLDINAGDSLIFGPYFLVPFGFALAVLVLEMGLVSRHGGLLLAALLAPAGLLVLAAVAPRVDPIYHEFLAIYSSRLGGDPLFTTLMLAMIYYGYATARRVPLASEGMTATLLALVVIGPDALSFEPFIDPGPTPILLAALLQLVLALRRRNAWHALVGAGCLVAYATLLAEPALRLPLGFHLAVLLLLAVGFWREECRLAGLALLFTASLASLIGMADLISFGIPEWYPPLIAGVLLCYGSLCGDSLPVRLAAVILTCWLIVLGWKGYRVLQEMVVGLNYLVISLSLFALAILVSLVKTGRLSRWIVIEERSDG